MKLPRLFKPKTQALPVADWVDYAAIQALQDQATAALSINEPLQRLLALKAAAARLSAVCDTADDNRGINNGLPLTDEGRRHYMRADKKIAVHLEKGLTVVGLGSLGAAATAATASAFFVGPLAIVVGVSTYGVGLVTGAITNNVLTGRAIKKLGGLEAAHQTINTLRQELTSAIESIECTLSFDDARGSPHFDAALKASPSLEERFAKEAGRAAMRGEITIPVEKRITKNPTVIKPL